METEKKISFDEIDANILYSAIRQQLKTVTWDGTAKGWLELEQLKSLVFRLENFLDGE